MSFVKLKGHRILLEGEFVQKGHQAPDFGLVGLDLSDHHLGSFAGKKKLLYIVPSLDTDTCLKSTKYFNEHVGKHHNSVILVISADLPFAMKRICGLEKISGVIPLSMMRNKNFAKDYGVLIKDGPLAGLCARAIVVLDEHNKIIYTQLVEEIASEPDYDNALRMMH
jgi:thiol peroxidase